MLGRESKGQLYKQIPNQKNLTAQRVISSVLFDFHSISDGIFYA